MVRRSICAWAGTGMVCVSILKLSGAGAPVGLEARTMRRFAELLMLDSPFLCPFQFPRYARSSASSPGKRELLCALFCFQQFEQVAGCWSGGSWILSGDQVSVNLHEGSPI